MKYPCYILASSCSKEQLKAAVLRLLRCWGIQQPPIHINDPSEIDQFPCVLVASCKIDLRELPYDFVENLENDRPIPYQVAVRIIQEPSHV